MKRMTKRQTERSRKPGRYRVADTLYLLVKPSGRKTYVQRIVIDGKRCDIGLGRDYDNAKLAAAENLLKIAKGGDPRKPRKKRVARAVQDATGQTFREVADWYIDNLPNARRKPSRNWLLQCAALHGKPINKITKPEILDLLEPIARKAWPTATRIRSMLSKIWEYAIARDMTDKNIVDEVRSQLDGFRNQHVTEHHDTIDPAEIKGIVCGLQQSSRIAAPALAFLIFTGARINEVLRLEWQDLDLDNRTWHLPVRKSKTRRAHRVPLNDGAMQVLESAGPLESGLVFPGRLGTPQSGTSTQAFLKIVAGQEAKQHAFRSALVSWGMNAGFENDLMAACIGHRSGTSSDRAYNSQADMFERRIPVMAAWSDYCMGKTPASNVVSLKAVQS